jgi:FtsZ-interacting cell division protein YlmF
LQRAQYGRKIRSRIEYETDQIKVEFRFNNSKQNLVYILSFVTLLGLSIYTIKAQKTRVLLYKQQQQKSNEDIYNLMISQQTTMDTIRVKEKKVHKNCMTAFWRMFGVRMNLDGLNGFQDEMAVSQRWLLIELKNIEDIREISHDLNREKSELINFVAIVDNYLKREEDVSN